MNTQYISTSLLSESLVFYINGELVKTESTLEPNWIDLEALTLGMNGEATGFPCQCHLNKVEVYSRSLKMEEVVKSYNR